jgi:hypothetical protein
MKLAVTALSLWFRESRMPASTGSKIVAVTDSAYPTFAAGYGNAAGGIALKTTCFRIAASHTA